jgi:hypothetical protein
VRQKLDQRAETLLTDNRDEATHILSTVGLGLFRLSGRPRDIAGDVAGDLPVAVRVAGGLGVGRPSETAEDSRFGICELVVGEDAFCVQDRQFSESFGQRWGGRRQTGHRSEPRCGDTRGIAGRPLQLEAVRAKHSVARILQSEPDSVVVAVDLLDEVVGDLVGELWIVKSVAMVREDVRDSTEAMWAMPATASPGALVLMRAWPPFMSPVTAVPKAPEKGSAGAELAAGGV